MYPQSTNQKIKRALALFETCRLAKAPLNARLYDEARWWQTRFETPENALLPPGARLFNAVANKHADAMDAFPTPTVLPREPGDAHAAQVLSRVLPVILANCRFADTYSAAWWDKLKHGTAAWGVFWNPALRRGNRMGDVDVRAVDVRRLYWEPGLSDIDGGNNLFITAPATVGELTAAFCPYPPGHPARGEWQRALLCGNTENDLPSRGAMTAPATGGTDAAQDEIDPATPVTVIDRYYKTHAAPPPDASSAGDCHEEKHTPNARARLHYMKIAGEVLLYDSAEDAAWRERGLYDHGSFPIVLDPLYPGDGVPWGYGLISLGRHTQHTLDMLSAGLCRSSLMGTQKRFFAAESAAVNEQEFLDWNRPIVHVQGEVSDARLREITVTPPDAVYLQVLREKTDELKEVTGNRDVNSGAAGAGVTAAGAIQALQEAGEKLSRDMIAASYRAFEKVLRLVIELVRQFYTEERIFRITGKNGEGFTFETFSNAVWQDAAKTPELDLEIRASQNGYYCAPGENRAAEQ